jgi:hypothetical protein
MFTKRRVGDDDNSSGSTLQADLSEIPATPGQLSRQQTESLENLFPTHKKTLRHSQSSGGLGLCTKRRITTFKTSMRRNSVSGSSSPDPVCVKISYLLKYNRTRL